MQKLSRAKSSRVNQIFTGKYQYVAIKIKKILNDHNWLIDFISKCEVHKQIVLILTTNHTNISSDSAHNLLKFRHLAGDYWRN